MHNQALDFTSPGAIPPDPSDVIRRIMGETTVTIHTLEALLENEQVEDPAGWKLLAMFYMVNDRAGDLDKIDKQYQKIFGSSLFMDLGQKIPQWCSIKNPFRLEMPAKITAQSLPDISIIQDACQTPVGAELDFSGVKEITGDGLIALTRFFTALSCAGLSPDIKGAARFISNMEKSATSSQSTRAIWEVLFAYDRFRNDKETFEDRAIRFAIHFGISPPSWE
ncbi:MAG: hypothetical protein RQ714_05575 [Nitrosomonas sp.]|nr:hypothetical protein [Nitrosomonas sp.]